MCKRVFENIEFQTYTNACVDDKINLSNESKSYTLPNFFISYLEMIDLLLLNINYAVRDGEWELLLECIHDILPYTFAFDYGRMTGFSETYTQLTGGR